VQTGLGILVSDGTETPCSLVQNESICQMQDKHSGDGQQYSSVNQMGISPLLNNLAIQLWQ